MYGDDQEARTKVVSPSFMSISETEKWENTMVKMKEFNVLNVKKSTNMRMKIVSPLVDKT